MRAYAQTRGQQVERSWRLTFADPMNELNPCDRPRRIDEGFEVQHRSGTRFDRPMVLLDDIV